MNYHFFVTSEMWQRINKRNLSTLIYDKLELNSSCNHQLGKDSNTSSPKVKVQRINTSSGPRLIYFEEVREDNTLYVLREVYDNHDTYMRKFNNIKDINIWKQWYIYSEREQEEIDLYFDSLKTSIVKPILPEELRKYEERPRRFEASNDLIIYEVSEWVNGYLDVDDLYKKSVYNELYAIIVRRNFDHEKFSREEPFYITNVDGYSIVMRFDTSSTDITGVYLLQISKSLNIEELIDHKYNCADITLLRRKASKCYPDFLLLDFETWKSIEDDSQANLVLSDEELSILQHIEYPFFVSGLAGSGKSTILYYLYAHIYDYEYKNHPEHSLVFLSYSKKLVANAQNIVKSILCHHPAYNLTDVFKDKAASRKFERSFQPFQDFIKGDFLTRSELELFSADKYIDYQRFKMLYKECKLPESKRYSPDIVWSVIRTFIKGKSSSGTFRPEDYESPDLPSKDRTITKVDYRIVYQIWNKWYKKIFEQKLGWDDLDLVRYALSKSDNDTRFHKYSIIFCDEAQDFTKIETDLILKLSLYSKYDLSTQEEYSHIPIAFAGDPNQTINPTGFRWGSTQETFNESFKDSLGAFSGFKPKELRYNYRSREGIVKFANTIQYIRHSLISDSKQSFSSQIPWDCENNNTKLEGESLNYVAFYSIDKNRDTIINGLNKAIIITSDEGEYNISHVSGDPDLYGVAPSKLFTAITAKGLEFKATILFKFGSDPAVALFEKLMNGETISNDSDKYILAHFFTKIYIAVSRAKQVLFVVDTDAGYNKLWKYFVNKELWLKIHQESRLPNDFCWMCIGDISDFEHRLEENYKPKEYAESLFMNAIDEENSDTMSRARSAYLEAKCEDKAYLCKAYIYRFNRQYKDAGRIFLKLNRPELALDTYWVGQDWEQVVNVLQSAPQKFESGVIKNSIAKFMSYKSTITEFLKDWSKYEEDFQDSLSNPKDRELWNKIVDRISTIATNLKPKDITASLVKNLDRVSAYLDWYEYRIAELRANLHFKKATFENREVEKNSPEFKETDYKAAIKCWDELPHIANDKGYYTSKKIISKSPSEEIFWMDKLDEANEIVSNYSSKEMAASLTEEAKNTVFKHLLSIDMLKAYYYPYPKDVNTKLRSLYMGDRAGFLKIIILKDFTIEKFDFFKAMVESDDANIFMSKTPADIFDSIFSLEGWDENGKPYWSYFVADLKNRLDERLFKKCNSRDLIKDSLTKIITSHQIIDKSIASCFLELLFDVSYDFVGAKRYLDAFTRLFNTKNSSILFGKDDFNISTKRNDYFTKYCPLSYKEVNLIRNNIHKFAKEYLSEINIITPEDDEKIVKPLFMAYEASVPYKNIGNENTPIYRPAYEDICDEYIRFIEDKDLKVRYALQIHWLERRLFFNSLLKDSLSKKSTFSQIRNTFENKDYDLNQFVRMLSKEDTIAYIIATNENSQDYSFKSVLLTTEAIRDKGISWNDFKQCDIDKLTNNISNWTDQAIEEILLKESNDRENEIELFSSVWKILGDNRKVARLEEGKRKLNNNRSKAEPSPVKQALIDVTRKLKAAGMDVKQIMEITKLSEKDILEA